MGRASNSCLKVKSYFKRFVVKPKRRRQGKTYYSRRRKLIRQDKNKYATRKYRLVVRKTNTKFIVQLTYATLTDDRVVCAAYSNELPRYGVKQGLKNYAAGYCTGLLLARRALQNFGLDKKYEGATEVTGEWHENVPEQDDDPNPLTAYLDIGLAASSTGNNVFGVLKGAVDGGLNVPHSERRFRGWDSSANDGEGEYNPEAHRDFIFGKHVADYMRLLKEEDEEKYKRYFSRYIKDGIGPDDLEDIYKKAHEAIRADPSRLPKREFKGTKVDRRTKKLTLEERKARVKKKIEELLAQAAEED